MLVGVYDYILFLQFMDKKMTG